MIKKKILITASTFPRWNDDTEPSFILDLCKEYLNYFDVTVLVPSGYGAKNEEIIDGVKVIRYRYFPIKKFETLAYPGAIVPRIKQKKIRALLVPFLFLGLFNALLKSRKKYDFIHANWIIPQGIVQSLFKEKYILSGLGGDVTSLNKWPLRLFKERALKKASAVTVVSNDLKKTIEYEYGITKVSVIPMGVNLSMYNPDNRVENFFENDGKPVILFVGRLAEKKGAKFLIQAMESIDAILIIVGDGPEKNELEKLSEKLDKDIRFVGPKTKEELRTIYASCDIFCIPSIVASDGDKDGLPVALLEAMASGAPVIASNIAGIPEVVNDNHNGLLVKPKDSEGIEMAIKKLLNDEKLRRRMSEESRAAAFKFSFDTIASEYVKLIKEAYL